MAYIFEAQPRWKQLRAVVLISARIKQLIAIYFFLLLTDLAALALPLLLEEEEESFGFLALVVVFFAFEVELLRERTDFFSDEVSSPSLTIVRPGIVSPAAMALAISSSRSFWARYSSRVGT